MTDEGEKKGCITYKFLTRKKREYARPVAQNTQFMIVMGDHDMSATTILERFLVSIITWSWDN